MAEEPRFGPIVCGLDGAPDCVDIARIAGEIATVVDTEVEFLHVLEGGPETDDRPTPTEVRMAATAMLDSFREASGRSSSKSHLIGFGDPGYWLGSTARSSDADLVVIGGSRDRTGRVAIGPAVTRLAVAAPCPVLVVPAALQHHIRPETWRERAFVCGVDGSPHAFAAALQAGALAARFGSVLSVAAVGLGEHPLESIIERLHARLVQSGNAPPRIVPLPLSGDPAWELEHAARALTAPVVVIGSHGIRSDEPIIGSVTWQLLVSAKRAVLVVPAASTGDIGVVQD